MSHSPPSWVCGQAVDIHSLWALSVSTSAPYPWWWWWSIPCGDVSKHPAARRHQRAAPICLSHLLFYFVPLCPLTLFQLSPPHPTLRDPIHMETVANLQTLEQYCETLFNPPDQSSRIQAESLLNYHCPTFSSNLGGADTSTGSLDRNSGLPNAHNPNIKSPIESALVCRNLLENARNPYALMYSIFFSPEGVFFFFFAFHIGYQHDPNSI